ncbi:exonuclease domain-containing protein [Streptomyces sp. NPDC017448]|uniref:exonuclease domain-containing protein n=1 Tax=Streptomyces sp. NPDC017448 TaxID=3364996 RepID=UPI003799727B
MNWWEGNFLAFDLETTGTDLEEARIVTASTALVHADNTVGDVIELLINPGVDIPQEASAVHGVTTEMAREAGLSPEFALTGIVHTLATALSTNLPVVAFNARFDLTVLDRDCRRHGVTTLSELTYGLVTPILDPFVLDKAVDKYRKGKRTLGVMSELYGVELLNAHNAVADAVAAAQITRAILRQYEGLRLPLDQLQRAQELWARQQAVSLERYFRQKNGDASITLDKEWPLVPFQEALV